MRQSRGFTLMEYVAAGVIAVILVVMGAAGWDAYQSTTAIVGGWTLAPQSIPAAPQSGMFVYQVWLQNRRGTVTGNVASHKVNFTLKQIGPSGGSITIESVTDGVNTKAVGGMSAT